MEAPPVLEPQSIKVFGVIHLVFGILGLLFALFSIATYIALPFVLNWGVDRLKEEMDSSDPGTEAVLGMLDAIKTLFADLTIVNWVTAITSLVVSFLILVAGIALLKKKKTGVAKSNRYVIASICAKVLNLGLYFAIGMAANAKYQEAISELTPRVKGARSPGGPGGLDMDQLQSMISSGGAVFGIALSAVYPILAYIMLNKPAVKDFLKNRGT